MPIIRSPSNCRCSHWFLYECGGGSVPAMVGLLANRPRLRTLLPPHSYGNQRLQRQFDRLLMMGIVMPETCWAVSIRQSNKFYDWLSHLVVFFNWVIVSSLSFTSSSVSGMSKPCGQTSKVRNKRYSSRWTTKVAQWTIVHVQCTRRQNYAGVLTEHTGVWNCNTTTYSGCWRWSQRRQNTYVTVNIPSAGSCILKP